MIFDSTILNKLTALAKESPRLRMNLDLRNSAEDGSQRMLNALEPGTVLPIHRHLKSSETVVCLRGHLRELFYDDNGKLTNVYDLRPGLADPQVGGVISTPAWIAPRFCVGLNIPVGQWHSVEVLESGTVILECKDGPYAPLSEDEIFSL